MQIIRTPQYDPSTVIEFSTEGETAIALINGTPVPYDFSALAENQTLTDLSYPFVQAIRKNGEVWIQAIAPYSDAYEPDDRPFPEPDPEPPTPQPDWGLFRSSLLTSPAYLRIAAHSPATQVLNANLGQVLWRLEQQPSLFPEAKALWDAIASEAAPTPEEIAALNAVGEISLVPLRLDSQGFLTLAP